MGLSIHYQGAINAVHLIPKLVDELKDISSTFQWDYYVFDDHRVKGICMSPLRCEPIIVAFTTDGKLVCPFSLYHDIHPSTLISVKTEFAGIEVHKAVIKLLKYLKANYFSEFELNDEGGYWESEDEKILQNQSNKYEVILDTAYVALKDFKSPAGETAESLADRLEKFLSERLTKR